MRDDTSTRKPYVKPDIVRIDLIEEEIALAVCKTLVPQTAVKGSPPGGCRQKHCKNDGRS